MGTIANKLAKLKTTKAEIKAALEEAGQLVGDVFDTYPAAIRAVVSGGVQIATGSYVGTGTYGVNNPNSLTFGFDPKFLLVSRGGYGFDSSNSFGWIYGLTETIGDFNDGYSVVSLSGRTISWYNTMNAESQRNYLNYTYYYLAGG